MRKFLKLVLGILDAGDESRINEVKNVLFDTVLKQDEIIEKQEKRLNHSEPLINNLKLQLEPVSSYKYKYYEFENNYYVPVRMYERTVLGGSIYAEEMIITGYSFTVALYDIKNRCSVSEAIAVVKYPDASNPQDGVKFSKWNKYKGIVEINNLWTDIEHRKKGFASFLLKHLIFYAKENGFELVYGVSRGIYECSLKLFKNVGFQINEDTGAFMFSIELSKEYV